MKKKKSKPKKLSKENIIVAVTVIILFGVLMMLYSLFGINKLDRLGSVVNLSNFSANDSTSLDNLTNFITPSIIESQKHNITSYNCTEVITKNGDYYCNLDNLTRIK